MKGFSFRFLVAIFVFLFAGWGLFRLINGGGMDFYLEGGFRDWFWEHRGLDLVVQVLLVFAGALGIAAVLPMEEEDD